MERSVIALVTGANRGLGFEVARQLLSSGCFVVLACRSLEAAEAAKRALSDHGDAVSCVEVDIADAGSVWHAAWSITQEHGCLDVLINNAGVLEPEDASVVTVAPDVLERTMRTNAIGPLLMSQAFLPLLERGNHPHIVNVSSGAGSLSDMSHWAPAYSISKTALNAVTRQLADALRGRVRVNSVCPGWVRTAMGGESAPRSVEEGASSILRVALNSDLELTGAFLRDGLRIEW